MRRDTSRMRRRGSGGGGGITWKARTGTDSPVDTEQLLADLTPDIVGKVRAREAIHMAGQLVRRMREKAGLSQGALAEATNTAQSAISDIERGVGSQGPTVAVLNKIALACGEVLVLGCQSDFKTRRTAEQRVQTLEAD